MKASNSAATKEKTAASLKPLMESVVERSNKIAALERVERKDGAAGIDEMAIKELRGYLKEHWGKIKE